MEFNSFPFICFVNSIHFLHHLFSKFSSLYQHPLFSAVVTLYTLILLYVPSLFLTILLSPVLNSTGIILLSLLRLGANEKLQQESSPQEFGILDSSGNERLENESIYLESRDVDDHKGKRLPIDGGTSPMGSIRFLDLVDQAQTLTHIESKPKPGLDMECNIQTHVESRPKYGLDMECNQTHVEFKQDMGLESNSMESSQVINGLGIQFHGSTQEEMDPKKALDTTTLAFLEWNMRAPLEIIYEAYEGEEEEKEDDENNENNKDSSNKQVAGSERYPSLSMYYSDSETNSSSDDDFPTNENWETYESVFFKWEEEEREELIEISLDRHGKRSMEICHAEEDNLIEIDIFPLRN